VTDVLVYGATAGGVVAAVAGARHGASVTLLEPGQHVGGDAERWHQPDRRGREPHRSTSMAVGHAAGVAAALASKRAVAAHDVDVAELQSCLASDGQVLRPG